MAMPRAAYPDNNFDKVLVVIDCFTRYAYALTLENGTQEHLWARFSQVLDEAPRRAKDTLRHLWVDRGTEFTSTNVNAAPGLFYKNCLRRGIQVYHTYSDNKSAMAERLIRTLREKLAVALTAHNTNVWSAPFPGHPRSLLDDVVHDYNYVDVHRVIGMTPIEAWRMCYQPNGVEKPRGVEELWYKLYSMRTAQKEKDRRPSWRPALEQDERVQFSSRPTNAKRRVRDVDEDANPFRYALRVEPAEGDAYEEEDIPRPDVKRYRRTKYNVGDWVRITTGVKRFAKKTDVMRWSAEKFEVVAVRTHTQPESYVLRPDNEGVDVEDEPLIGSFYASDLASTKPPTDPGHFDEVLRVFGVRRSPAQVQPPVRQFRVQLFGQPASTRRWLPETGPRGVGDLTNRLPTQNLRVASIQIANQLDLH
jgi:hypothetical protein